MTDQAGDFLKLSQALAQQSWESWMQALQQGRTLADGQGPVPGFSGMPFAAAPFSNSPLGSSPLGNSPFDKPAAPTVEGMFERALGGMKSYFDWMQQAATAQTGSATPMDWQTQLQKMFSDGQQPFAKAFEGIDSTAAQGFVQQWQTWLKSMGQGGVSDLKGAGPLNMPAFGLHREQTQQQQALFAAMLESAQQQQRYQSLIMRANVQGLERLQAKLVEPTEPGREVNSMKALYDLWVDAAEEAYAQIALSEEFSEVYGAMVNAQMLERSLQQEQLEQFCRQLGMPTRSDFESLGRRLQELHRAQRADAPASGGGDELAALRAEIAELKKTLADQRATRAPAPASASGTKAAAKKTSAKKATAKKTTAKKATATKTPDRTAAPKASSTGKKSAAAKTSRTRRSAAKAS